MDSKNIFRKTALDRLSSPEQLDQLIQVTSPRSWLILAAVFLLLVAFMGWGVLGQVSTKVQGQGIILGGSIYDVVGLWPGQVLDVRVGVGDEIEVGDPVVEVAQPELAQELHGARAKLAELRDEHASLREFGEREVKIQQAYIADQRANLERNVDELSSLLETLNEQLRGEQQIYEEGVIAQGQLIVTQRTVNTTRSDIATARAELTKLESSELNVRFDVERQLIDSEQRIHEAERQVRQLESAYERRTRVLSPVRGRVLELMVDHGSVISEGQVLLKLSLVGETDDALRVVLYVSTEDGKRIVPGMAIHVAPTTVRPEEFGYVEGHVLRIADFPSTTAGMLHVLKNDQLVSQLSARGSTFEVLARLDRDTSAPSGYAWTSGGGPDVTLRGGTPASASIIVETRRPIDLAIPAFKALFSRE